MKRKQPLPSRSPWQEAERLAAERAAAKLQKIMEPPTAGRLIDPFRFFRAVASQKLGMNE